MIWIYMYSIEENMIVYVYIVNHFTYQYGYIGYIYIKYTHRFTMYLRFVLGGGDLWVFFSTYANQSLCQLQLSLSCCVFLGFGRSLFTIVVSSFFQMFPQNSGYHMFTMCIYIYVYCVCVYSCVLLFVFWLFVYNSVIYSIWTDMHINNKQFSSPAMCVCVCP